MFQGLQGWHFIILLVIILLLFGAPRLPALARSLGQSFRIFKGEVKQAKKDDADDATAAGTVLDASVEPAAESPITRPSQAGGTASGPTAAEPRPAEPDSRA